MNSHKNFFIVKTGDSRAIDCLIKNGIFDNWRQIPKHNMKVGDVAFIYDKNLTDKARGKMWTPIKCIATISQVGESDIGFNLLHKINYEAINLNEEEKSVISKMRQGTGVYELIDDDIITKVQKCKINK